MFSESFLNRMQSLLRGSQALDGQDPCAVRLHRVYDTRPHARVVEKDCAGAAYSMFAANMGAPQAQVFAQKSCEGFPRLDLSLVLDPVHGHFDASPTLHRPLPSPAPELP